MLHLHFIQCHLLTAHLSGRSMVSWNGIGTRGKICFWIPLPDFPSGPGCRSKRPKEGQSPLEALLWWFFLLEVSNSLANTAWCWCLLCSWCGHMPVLRHVTRLLLSPFSFSSALCSLAAGFWVSSLVDSPPECASKITWIWLFSPDLKDSLTFLQGSWCSGSSFTMALLSPLCHLFLRLFFAWLSWKHSGSLLSTKGGTQGQSLLLGGTFSFKVTFSFKLWSHIHKHFALVGGEFPPSPQSSQGADSESPLSSSQVFSFYILEG